MKALSKIFVLLFGLSSIKQYCNVYYYTQSIENETERLSESLPNTNIRTVNRKTVSEINPQGFSKNQFIQFMYNTQRVICL